LPAPGAAGAHDLSDRGCHEELTHKRLEHGEALARVRGRDEVAVPGRGEGDEEEILAQRALAVTTDERIGLGGPRAPQANAKAVPISK
jgi:hypothetical protein